ncbi:MAG: PocR ligand-binding domain-containing protein [Acidobacteriota bacterium]
MNQAKNFLNVTTIQHMLDNMFAVTGLSSMFIDSNGVIMAKTEFYRICQICHFTDEDSSLPCIESQIFKMHRMRKKPKKFKCQNGLNTYSLPLNINGGYIGSLYFVQFYESPIDHDRFLLRVQHDCNDEDLSREMNKIPVIHDSQLRAIAQLLNQLVSNISLAAISAGIVHEITQPVNSIKVAADGILYWYKRGQRIDISDAMTKLEQISSEVKRIEQIIKYIRSLAESGHQMDKMSCNINEIFMTVLSKLYGLLSPHDVTVTCNLDSYIPDIEANTSLLEEVMINLITNAIQALIKSSKVSKELICSTRLDQMQIIIEVADNAIGIKEEIVPNMFDPFYSTKNHGESLGLGLFIVHAIVSDLGGSIDVENNTYGGATFRVRFPLTQCAVLSERESDVSYGSFVRRNAR